MNVTDCLAIADTALSAPPPEDWIEREAPRGELVARFVLPLSLCPTTNSTRHAPGWKLGKLKAEAYAIMAAQHGRRSEPLPGRPHVRCIRFSSRCPDASSNGFKLAVDKLISPTKRAPQRLGFIAEDSPRHAKITQHWEPAPRGRGFGLVEVWTGKTIAPSQQPLTRRPQPLETPE